jgi:RNA polymerase sigma-70 factor (ECF subfamily)
MELGAIRVVAGGARGPRGSPRGRGGAARHAPRALLRRWLRVMEARMDAAAGSEPTGARAHPDAAEVAGSDAELRALRAGDEAAFLALVHRHHAAMVRIATLYVGSRATAEEVAQEAWIGVLKGLHLFEGRSSLKSWIFRILVNCAKARGVREVRSIPLSSLAPDDAGGDEAAVPADRFRDEGLWAGHWAEPPTAWTDDRLGEAELAAVVRAGIAELPPAQRQVMTLRDVEGWDAADVCELLRLSEGNQRVLLHRARSKVRAYVEARLSKEVEP